MRAFYFVLISLALLTSCWKPGKNETPDILVLVLENWNPSTPLCDRDQSRGAEGFASLCQNGAREVEVFRSLSLRPQISMASFLFPEKKENWGTLVELKPIPATEKSIAEVASETGRSTWFLSSSPLWARKWGFHQGFSTYEETSALGEQRWGLTAQQVFKKIQTALEESTSPRFVVATFSDLTFPWAPTASLLNPESSGTLENQMDSFDEALGVWLQSQKNKKSTWRDAWIFILGLQGTEQNRSTTKTALLVKPPRELQNHFDWNFQTPQTLGAWINLVLTKKENQQPAEQNPLNSIQISDWSIASVLALAPKEKVNFHLSDKDPCLQLFLPQTAHHRGACDIAFLNHLEDWWTQAVDASNENSIREARLKTLLEFHNLENLRRLSQINAATGSQLSLSPQVINWIERSEGILALPSLLRFRTWLEKNEPPLRAVGTNKNNSALD